MIAKIDGKYYDIGVITGDPILMEGYPEYLDYKWKVLRQDDHGNKFEVAVGLEKLVAEKMVAEYEAKGHKQLYWIETE